MGTGQGAYEPGSVESSLPSEARVFLADDSAADKAERILLPSSTWSMAVPRSLE